MATLKFENVNKVYDNNVQAVFDFNLDVKDKEFIVFVGPSGCGKSTTLRMLAGLEDITSGNLFIDNKLMNNVEPKDREIAMVFQNYALYPHMTVYKNIAFSLKIRKYPEVVHDENGNTIPVVDKKEIERLKETIKDAKFTLKYSPERTEEIGKYIAGCEAEIKKLQENPSAVKVKMVHMPKEEVDKRVKEAAEILGLTEYLKRKPAALSGGQRQRVALGRAIVRNPKVFLMDEPLSNLDAKLRVQMRTEITRIHKEVGATTVYVTHDQTEAMTMADRIVVMKLGYVQQIGTPLEIYDSPANLFVATFIGSPSMNIFEAIFDYKNIKLGDFKLSISPDFKKKCEDFYGAMEDENKKIIDVLNDEIEFLSKNPKRNAKAIEQRKEALENATKAYEFSKEVMSESEHKLYLGIRPEDIQLAGEKKITKPSKPIEVIIKQTELLGQDIIVYSEIAGQPILFKAPTAMKLKVEDKIKIELDLNKLHLFDFSSTKRLPFDSGMIK